MQVILEDDSTSCLGLPYGLESTPERKFWNLEENPDFINNIPEVADFPELKNFLLEVASPSCKFCTFGCEKWEKKVDYQNEITHEAGMYIDFSFNYLEIAQNKKNYLDLLDKIKVHASLLSANNKYSNLSLIRFQPKKAGLVKQKIHFWILTAWIFGCGSSLKMAQKYRIHALSEFLKCLKDYSLFIDNTVKIKLSKILTDIS